MKENRQIPRPEYPYPQFCRETWENLNGEWEFYSDYGKSGAERKIYLPGNEAFEEKITVPFCKESKLSGIGNTDFCESVWYRKTVMLENGRLSKGERVLLHIGASDYQTTVYVNGEGFMPHYGGYVSFAIDITDALKDGENTIVIHALDEVRSGRQPGGKQSRRYYSHGCDYTRTTGIWQTVFLEAIPNGYLKNFKITPDVENGKISVSLRTENADGLSYTVEAYYEGRAVGKAEGKIGYRSASCEIKLSEIHLWEIGEGRLYDLVIKVGEDKVSSYFGMRSVKAEDGVLYLNGKKVFQRLILDQGFYPDGIYTAPTAAELKNDILRSMAMGFHGARLHQKVFEPLFLRYCDELGYIVWGEHGNWGLNAAKDSAFEGFLPEWTEIVERDYNHPSIIGWCPLNETQFDQNDHFVSAVADLTRSLDPTRPVIDTSGWRHVPGATDLMDCHDYDQDPVTFRERYEKIARGEAKLSQPKRNPFEITPTFVSEYGGIRWAPDYEGWGYGNAPKTAEEFIERYIGLAEALLDNPGISGLCYTQLTDVEQEVNGLYTYDRVAKFDPQILKAVLDRPAAIEEL